MLFITQRTIKPKQGPDNEKEPLDFPGENSVLIPINTGFFQIRKSVYLLDLLTFNSSEKRGIRERGKD
ncbi:MAG: hypothetical protein EBW87_02440 [Burkholderiaceae bacterium]|nr:hypothetical protein [Burkholderiaceae bacterium]